ncbi:M28 family peptidase [Pyxidicoccus parkwayensis]|uniref:M28 family peptidase n=1 Tax=Pyxidicoccus parkwayensis TaxID=2813578 RepID=A0ABX7P0D6_9BACT|nr:M28 family peptidase [Pyxidicoccus parkwaysis]QSQ24141.1 M28 family peptidase [Pyxidicoccus parkwaysis]
MRRGRLWLGIGVATLATVGLARAFICGPHDATTPPAPTQSGPTMDAERLRAHVRMLSETLHPRDSTHPQNLDRAADYIADHLASAGGSVERHSLSFSASGPSFTNISARFGPEDGERLIVGAHYDAAPGTPGADDNASGVAALLELAVLLGRNPPPLRVDLVAYTLEEPPYFGTPTMGSAMHARKLRDDGVKVRGMLALEMLGCYSDVPGSQKYPLPVLGLRYPDTGLFIGVVGKPGDGGLTDAVAGAMRAGSPLPVESLVAPAMVPGVALSDHASFWEQGFRAVMVTDTAYFRNPRYHTSDDTWDSLDYVRMAHAVQAVYAAVRTLASGSLPGN